MLVVLAVPATSNADTDVLIFDNGDRLTGELKSMERGKVRFDTDATGTIPIEWDNVASLESNQNVQVETDDGSRYLGQLSRDSEARRLIVATNSGPVRLDIERVVYMMPIESRTLDRVDGRISLGYNFAQASKVQQFLIGLDVDYRTETRILGLSADAALSDSENNEASRRKRADLQYTRLRPRRWVSGGVLRFDSNDALGVDLRTSLGIGGGRYLQQTNSQVLLLTGGLQGSREEIAGASGGEDSLEAFATLKWDWFRYDYPQLDLSTTAQVIPNLTNTGRLRSELEIKLSWELIEDLVWQINYFRSSDSDPGVSDTPKIDYGISTSLGYSF